MEGCKKGIGGWETSKQVISHSESENKNLNYDTFVQYHIKLLTMLIKNQTNAAKRELWQKIKLNSMQGQGGL